MKKLIILFAILALLCIKPEAQTVTDYDGNVYHTITIGTQTWMQENLKVTHYKNGIYIANITDSDTWANLSVGGRCYYNNDSIAYHSEYGSLYNWYTIESEQICPDAWHVPSDSEWTMIENYLGGSSIAGGKMKEAGYDHWLSPNVGANNSSRFTGLPGGMRTMDYTFQTLYENGLWWASTPYNSSMSWSRYLWYMYAGVDRNPAPNYLGLSIRCIKDISSHTNEMNKPNKIRIFPNPASSVFTIDCAEGSIYEITLYNMAGQSMLSKEVQSGSNQIDISTLVKGIYILKCKGADGMFQKKLIKE